MQSKNHFHNCCNFQRIHWNSYCFAAYMIKNKHQGLNLNILIFVVQLNSCNPDKIHIDLLL